MKENESQKSMTKKEGSKALPTTERKMTEAEEKLMARFRKKLRARHAAPRMEVDRKPGEDTTLKTPGDTEQERLINLVNLMDAFGTTSLEFQSHLTRELMGASCPGTKLNPSSADDINGVLAAMQGIAPRDEIEGMLASQMVSTHFAAMRCMRLLKNSDRINQQDSNGNLAIKLLRTYTAQMEALQRYRGKTSQQKVTVEHVHVHEGGQAIVGNVTHGKGGGGIPQKTEEQPHAPGK